jgi:pilus assembly protein CpaB
VSISIFSKKSSILIPLVLAAIGVFLVTQYLKTKEGELGLSAELVPVLVANADIPAYTKLDKTMVSMFAVPKKYLQPSALKDVSQIDKRVTLVPLLKGDQILATMVSDREQPISLSMKIRQGFRAVSIGVDAVSGVSGLLRPGDKVDVLGTFDLTKNSVLEKRTFTLLHNIVVLAVGKYLGTESLIKEALKSKNAEELKKRLDSLRTRVIRDNKRQETVTLLVEPAQAQKIVLTQQIGRLSLSLCSKVDENEGATPKSINGKEMLGIEENVYIPRPWGEIHGAVQR